MARYRTDIDWGRVPPEERGPWGRFLFTRRWDNKRETQESVRLRLREQGYEISETSYSDYETGARKVNAEWREKFSTFWGGSPEPETEPSGASPDIASLVEAIGELVAITREQTTLLAQLWPAIGSLVGETRVARKESEEQAGALGGLLAEQSHLIVQQTRALQVLLDASSTPGEPEQQQRPARSGGR